MKEKLEKLQSKLALIDLLSSKTGDGLGILIMKDEPLQIRMEPDHHKTPHIHISYKKEYHKASYAIKDGKVLAGSLKSKYDKTVKAWIKENKLELEEIWRELKEGNQKKYELLLGEIQEKK